MIKYKIIQTEKGRLLVIGGIPEGYEYFRIGLGELFYSYRKDDWNRCVVHNISEGKWESLGRLSEMKEEDAEKIVDKDEKSFYRIYNHPIMEYGHSNATESLLSLIESEVKLRNKIGKKEPCLDDYKEYNDWFRWKERWIEEEETVYHDPVLFWESNK